MLPKSVQKSQRNWTACTLFSRTAGTHNRNCRLQARQPKKYAELIVPKGELRLNTKLKNLPNWRMRLETNNGTFETRFVINCAGLHSDIAVRVKSILKPRLSPSGRVLRTYSRKNATSSRPWFIQFPIQIFRFWVSTSPVIDGSVHAGPNAVLSLKGKATRKQTLTCGFVSLWHTRILELAAKHAWRYSGNNSLLQQSSLRQPKKLIPEVTADDLVPTHAGVRAQALQNDGKLVDDFDCRRQCSCLQCPFSSCHFFNGNWQSDALAIPEHSPAFKTALYV